MAAITTLIVDDHAYFRRSLRRFIESQPQLQVVGEAADGQNAIACSALMKPLLVVMDNQMPKITGLDACQIIKHLHPEIHIVLYSAYVLEAKLGRECPADAFISKDRLFLDLVPTIEQIVSTATRAQRPASLSP